MSTPNRTVQSWGLALAGLCLASALGCSNEAEPDPEAEPEIAASTRNQLLWKRYQVLEQDLSRALELAPEELCTELGSYDCVDDIHLVALGGHDPFGRGQYAPVAKPMVTTPLAVERVVLAACSERVARDHDERAVFTALELDGPAPAATSDAFIETVDALYQRLLSRDPIDAEYEVLAELLVDDQGEPVLAERFAAEACVAVATTTEFIFI